MRRIQKEITGDVIQSAVNDVCTTMRMYNGTGLAIPTSILENHAQACFFLLSTMALNVENRDFTQNVLQALKAGLTKADHTNRANFVTHEDEKRMENEDLIRILT